MRKLPKSSSLFDASAFLTGFRNAMVKDMEPTSMVSPYHNVCYNRQVKNFDKKFIVHENTDERRDKAYAKFLQVNLEMHSLNKSYVSASTWEDDPVLMFTKNLVSFVLGPPPLLEDVFLGSKNSNGTSIGVSFMDTSPEKKLRYPISGTNTVIRMWEHYLEYDKELAVAVRNLNEVSGCYPETVSTRGSRACTVPKTNDIDRMICVEPTLNMYFQQGIKALMDDRLKRIGLSLKRDQELHRRLACYSSITNRLATIDFSSMSDRVSLALCHFLLPKGWYSWFYSTRSHRILLNGEYVELGMISTMGNATTFPIETLFLWALAYASIQFSVGWKSSLPAIDSIDSTFCRVFGDDCILPAFAVDLFFEKCSKVGFVPNPDKSFFRNENFRESCGGDFYHGRDVRPFYLKSLPKTLRKRELEAYFYTTINGVFRMYKKYFGTLTYLYDKSLLAYLFKCLSMVTDFVKFVPSNFPEDSGIAEMQDLNRIRRCYRLRISPISVDNNGMLLFSYLAFTYRFSAELHEGLRYAIWLKTPGNKRDDVLERERSIDLENKVRKRGLYVQRNSRKVISLRLPTTISVHAPPTSNSRSPR
jgi:hypothetical protein